VLAGLAVAISCAAAAADWEPVAAGVEYRHVEREGFDAHVIRVDLANQEIHLVATRESERGLTVSEFARRRSAIVAINADYFDAEMHPLGLAVGACGVWSEGIARGRHQEVVGIGAHQVQIFPRRKPLRKPEPWMTGAVSGWPMIVSDCEPLERLPGSDFFTHAPHPRTALGLSQDGVQLYLVVVDGRREHVPGVTLPELAEFMDELGACTAVNLDGGGSSAMWVGDRVVNQPSDLIERRVVNHLAVVPGRDEAPCDAP
jgi:exopolysaccharide biosynthesis protein